MRTWLWRKLLSARLANRFLNWLECREEDRLAKKQWGEDWYEKSRNERQR